MRSTKQISFFKVVPDPSSFSLFFSSDIAIKLLTLLPPSEFLRMTLVDRGTHKFIEFNDDVWFARKHRDKSNSGKTYNIKDTMMKHYLTMNGIESLWNPSKVRQQLSGCGGPLFEAQGERGDNNILSMPEFIVYDRKREAQKMKVTKHHGNRW